MKAASVLAGVGFPAPLPTNRTTRCLAASTIAIFWSGTNQQVRVRFGGTTARGLDNG
jgi:hypothetical protein